MNLFAFTRRLIDIPSPSGDEDAATRFLAAHLESLGYTVELQEIAPRRANIIANASPVTPRLFFSTHIDTVPPFIASHEDETHIYGRGSCDAKGIIAAQIFAAETLRRVGVDEIGLLFTVDEELGSLGARAANTHALAATCDYLVNGEPTGNKLATGSKGSLRLRLNTTGRAAHSAYPEHGDSAIERLLDVLEDVRRVEWPQDDFFGATTCNIGTITGGARPNIIPAEASAELQIRLVTGSSRVKELFERAVGGRAEVEYLSVAEPVRLFAPEGFAREVVRFTTDVPYLPNWGAPLLLGPGSILDAHTAAERISKDELARSVELYAQLARELLARRSDMESERNPERLIKPVTTKPH
ncbi:MAG TPA: M20/M25/M40 family metallo-hydrolase [Pyrinomonadaceae bacterium]|jgi:acetylornithine deacetylase|nr:M20/M25/M40 family metallo-hydrolase [Pyrinomonadaceae bacterium]